MPLRSNAETKDRGLPHSLVGPPVDIVQSALSVMGTSRGDTHNTYHPQYLACKVHFNSLLTTHPQLAQSKENKEYGRQRVNILKQSVDRRKRSGSFFEKSSVPLAMALSYSKYLPYPVLFRNCFPVTGLCCWQHRFLLVIVHENWGGGGPGVTMKLHALKYTT